MRSAGAEDNYTGSISTDATASVLSLEFGLGQWHATERACACASLHRWTTTRAHGLLTSVSCCFLSKEQTFGYVSSVDCGLMGMKY
jgi:hypothetical protein